MPVQDNNIDVKYNTAMRMNKLEPDTTKWITLTNIILSGKCQTQEST